MEIVSPTMLIYTLSKAPLSTGPFNWNPTENPAAVLAYFFLLHYLNRAIISPLRTPSRSKSNVIVPLSAILFNLVNGSLMGAYLSSPPARTFLAGAFHRPIFWAGLGVATIGLAGNILHDEILLNIRRKANSKGKSKASDSKKEHYGIPQGYLYDYISYPNYFCEWCEWLGFCLAAAPVPTVTSGLGTLLATASPPWLFMSAEIMTMFPRAYRGHKWYHEKFPDYPKERKIVIPFLL